MNSGRVDDMLHLSVLDQNSARSYVQTLQMFPFPDDSKMHDAVKTLADALSVTLKKLPFLAGTIGPVNDDSGKLSLKHPNHDLIPDVKRAGLFSVKTLSSAEYPHTYAELKLRGMPPSCFDGKTFCPYVLRNQPGVPEFAEGWIETKHYLPVLAVEAFFIQGGLVLSIYMHHNVVDCSGMTNFWKHFADSVKNRRTAQTYAGVEVPNQSELRSGVDARIQKTAASPIADAFIDTAFEYNKTLPDNTPCSAKIFVVPAARIRAFRDQQKLSLGTDTPLTICNLIAALVWIHVTRARSARLNGRPDCQDTSIGIAIDTRKRLDPPLTEEYMGVMATFAKATLPLSKFTDEERVSESTVLSTALEINNTISRIDNAWVLRHLAFFEKKVPITSTEPAIRFRFGPDIYITSWLNFGAEHQWDIPGTTSERPEFIRRTSDRNSDGGIIIMPRRRAVIDGQEAPYEILIRLSTEDMHRLENEEGGLSKWAEHIIE